MCTVTWVRESDDGYTLCVSRDEKHIRKAASPPTLQTDDGIRFLAPLDGERGGSWVAVNERGLSVCLLNRYEDEVEPRSGPSRGEIVIQLASSPDREDAARRLWARDLSRYQPFTAVCLQPGLPALAVEWTGVGLSGNFEAEARRPLSSSSVAQSEACRARRELFESFRARGLTKGALIEFHTSHTPERGALSPCMHREDAATVSLTVIEVSPSEVRMAYQQGAPCEGGPFSVLGLARGGRPDVRTA